MPIMTLTFNLSEEADEANAAHHGAAVVGILADLDNELRSLIKYRDGDTVDKAELIRLRRIINEGCGEEGIRLF